MHVLLATKHPNLRLSIELLLSHEPGVAVLGAASETEGLLALIKSTSPDIVILDWDLPGRLMVDFLDEAHILAVQAKFIVLGNQPEMRRQALQAGADAFVVEGDPPEKLLAAFREARTQIKSTVDESATKKE